MTPVAMPRREIRLPEGNGTRAKEHSNYRAAPGGWSAQRTTTTRVMLIDDHKLFAEAVASVLANAGMEIVHVATNAAEARECIADVDPELVLVDLGLPDADGIELGAHIIAGHPYCKVVALTARNDVRAVKDALRAGFHGFLTKDTPMSSFATSVQAALAGQVVVPHRLAAPASGARSSQDEDARLRASQLTSREREVLGLLVEGAGSEHISAKLHISPHTVRTHVQNILTKLQVRSRLEAATFAVRYGLVELPATPFS